ncbi:hypothetical protein [Kitasatospora griseola]|uniref:hypothetical protein n=1 Tax=Kitasatospora griseola TaxID=2064 RepID=UPI00381D8DC1
MTEPPPLLRHPGPAAPAEIRPADRPPAEPTDAPSESENAPMPEQELSDVFERAVGDAAPDLGLLVAGATAEGRAIRLRRRAALAGTVLAVAGLALGGGLLLRPAPPALTVSPGADASMPPVPTPRSTLPSGLVPVNGFDARALLGKLLGPKLVVDTWDGRRSTSDAEVQTVFLAGLRSLGDDRTGTLRIQVAAPTGRRSPWPSDSLDCAARPVGEKCATLTGDGGTGIAVTRYDEAGQLSYVAELRRGDGLLVTLAATGADGNAPLVTWQNVTRWTTDPDWSALVAREEPADLGPQPTPGLGRGPTGRPSSVVQEPAKGTRSGSPTSGTAQ